MKNNNSFWPFLVWLVVTIGLVAGLAIYQNNRVSHDKPARTVNPIIASSVPVVTSPAVTPPVVMPGVNVTLNMAEIAKHSSVGNCWLLISSKVYNVTSFISSHPGGANLIIRYCGQEATQAFNTKDIGRSHSSSAAAMLASYYIGDFNQTIGQSQIQQNVQQTNTIVPPVTNREEDD